MNNIDIYKIIFSLAFLLGGIYHIYLWKKGVGIRCWPIKMKSKNNYQALPPWLMYENRGSNSEKINILLHALGLLFMSLLVWVFIN